VQVAVGCDHAGFPLKATVVETLQSQGHGVIDCGTDSTDSVDYPDYASAVAAAILAQRAQRGILLCGSGVGAAVAACKIDGIRASVCHDTYSARQGVEHDDMNVLCLGARIVGEALAVELVQAFLQGRYTAVPRHERRLNKVKQLESRRRPFDEEQA
jgi:ribose 5-phosphate isomerase B